MEKKKTKAEKTSALKKRYSIVKKIGISLGCIIIIIITVLIYQNIQISEEEFFKALYKGDFEIVKEYIDSGNDVNAIDKSNIKQTPLSIVIFSDASTSEQTQIAKYLIDKEAKVNVIDSWGRTPLYKSVLSNNKEIFDTLLRKGADPNLGSKKPLLYISGYGINKYDAESRNEFVNLLIKHKADVNCRSKEGKTPLIEAANGGFFKTVSILVEAGANVNLKDKDGKTALIKAAEDGSYKTVELLINAGADVKAYDKDGMTSLMQVCDPSMYDSTNLEILLEWLGKDWNDLPAKNRIISILVKNGAKINAKNNEGTTSLLMAISWSYKLWLNINRRGTDELRQVYPSGFAKIIKVLLENGATPNVKNEVGTSALMIAVAWGNIEVINALIRHGANVNAKNNEGKSVLDVARVLGTSQIINIIRNAKNKRTKSLRL